MKRPLIPLLIIGLLVAAITCALHASGIFRPLERAIANFVSRSATINRQAIDLWQYLLVVVFSFGVAAFTLTSAQRARSAWLAAALLIEMVALTWICSLYGTLFQPLPSIFAVVIAVVAAEATVTFTTPTRPG